MSRWLLLLVAVVMGGLGLTTACGSDAKPADEFGTLTVGARLVTDPDSPLNPANLVLRVHGTRKSDSRKVDFIIDTSSPPFQAIRNDIPAGTWSFRAEADDDLGNTDPAHDPADATYQSLIGSDVTISASTVSNVELYLYDPAGAAGDFTNTQPRISSASRRDEVVRTTTVVTLNATFSDPDTGDVLDLVWDTTQCTAGVLGTEETDERNPTASTSTRTWTAPSTPGTTCILTLIATDSKQAKAGVRFTISVGNVTFVATFNAHPQLDPTEGLVADYGANLPGPLTAGDVLTLTVTATDPDNDELYVRWDSTCGNGAEFSEATAFDDGEATVVFQPAAVGSTCVVTATVYDRDPDTNDPEELFNTATLTLQGQAQ